jgi:hypothetical protein
VYQLSATKRILFFRKTEPSCCFKCTVVSDVMESRLKIKTNRLLTSFPPYLFYIQLICSPSSVPWYYYNKQLLRFSLPLKWKKRPSKEHIEITYDTVVAYISGQTCCLDMLKKTTRNLGEHSRWPGKSSNRILSESNYKALNDTPTCSVR